MGENKEAENLKCKFHLRKEINKERETLKKLMMIRQNNRTLAKTEKNVWKKIVLIITKKLFFLAPSLSQK